MNYTLYKLDTGFIVTSDEEIKEGDLVLNSLNCIQSFLKDYNDINAEKVIAKEPNIIFSDLKEEEQKKIGWFDVDSFIKQHMGLPSYLQVSSMSPMMQSQFLSLSELFQKSQELLSDRMFTLEDMENAFYEQQEFNQACEPIGKSFDQFIKSLSQKSWSVELEMEDKISLDGHTIIGKEPKLTDGKVKILKLL